MNQTIIEVFYSPTCPNCPPQKKVAKKFEDNETQVKLTNAQEEIERTQRHNVRSVPTTIIHGPEIDESIGFKGVTSEDRLREAVAVAKGQEAMESLKTPTLLETITNLFS